MIHGLKALAAAMLLVLAGCVATGHNFDSSNLSDMTPGQTTMAQAVYLLAAPPDHIYPQSDGTTLAIWRVHVTVLTDGIYATQEVRLLFGPDGRLMRLVDTTNVPLSDQARRKLLGVAPPPAPPSPAVPAGAGATTPAPATASTPTDSLRTYAIPIPSAPAPVFAQ